MGSFDDKISKELHFFTNLGNFVKIFLFSNQLCHFWSKNPKYEVFGLFVIICLLFVIWNLFVISDQELKNMGSYDDRALSF